MISKKLSSPVIVAALFLSSLLSIFILINLLFAYSLPLYILVAAVALVLSFIYPLAAIFAITFLTLVWSQNFTLSPLIINQVEYKFYLLDLLLVPLYFRTALDWLKYRNLKLKGLDQILLLFFAWVAIIFGASLAYWDGNFSTAFSSLKNYTFYPLIFFVVWYYFRDRQIFKTWLNFFVAGVITSLGFFAYGLINGHGLWTEITPLSTEGSRFLDFNHAFYLCLAFIIGLSYLIWRKDRLSKVFAWLLPLFFAGIIGSLMRHLWLALAAYLIWLIVSLGSARASLKTLVAKYLAAALLVLSLGLFIINLLPQSHFSQSLSEQQGYLSTRVLSLFDDGDTSIAWRGTLWQAVWSNFLDQPLLGQGLGQKVFIDMGDYKDYVELRNIHNSFLAILIQLGLVGFVLLIIFVLGQLIKIWRFPVTDSFSAMLRYAFGGIIIFCLIAFLFQPYLEANFFSLWWWIFLGLAHAYYEGTLSK